MIRPRRLLKKILVAYPGEKYFKEYRFLPVFFFAGAALEYVMINWVFGGTNFYKTFKRRKVQEIIEEREKVSFLDKIEINLKH